MTTDSRPEISNVNVTDLAPGMIITAYTGFSSRYTPLEENTCEWVKHNFKGATVLGMRNQTVFQGAIADLQPGDSIREILDIPPTLKHICQVNEKLVEELGKRGFIQFRIQLPMESAKPGTRSAQVARAATMISDIRESLNLCNHATAALESIMDNTTDATPNFREVQDYVERLSAENTIEAVSAIIALKENDHVYAHCVDVGVIFQQVYFAIMEKKGEKSVFKDKQEAMLAAFLHDIGKARIPKEIITSTKLFKPNSPEIQEIRKHVEYGAQLLSKAGMSEVIVNMAHYHHVKKDETMSSSYPKGVTQADTMFETRLLAIIDTYQALISGRSYKKAWTPSAVIRYLDAIADIEFDLDLWTDFQEVMGYYPIGSLVQLSDDSQAFVINVPKKDLLNPQVAVIIEADGTRSDQHRLIDLAESEALSIKKDLDAVEVFQENAFTIFSNLNIV